MLLSLAVAGLVSATTVAGLTSMSSCPPAELSVRIPPYLDHAVNASSNTSSASRPPTSSFEAPPTGWFAATWSIRNTSGASYLNYSNLQWDLTPSIATCEANTTRACPPGTIAGVLNEVVTWVPADNRTALNGAIGGGGREVASVRAYNTPRRLNYPALNSDWDGVFDNTVTVGPATGYRQSWSVMYWGSDSHGMPFMIVHEAPAIYNTGEIGTPAVHVISINPAGAAEGSMTDALEALVNLGNSEVTSLINDLVATEWDDTLLGGPAICGCKCINNEPKVDV